MNGISSVWLFHPRSTSGCVHCSATASLVQTLAEAVFTPQGFPSVWLAGSEREVNVDHAQGKEGEQTAGKTDGYSQNVPGQFDVFSLLPTVCIILPALSVKLGEGKVSLGSLEKKRSTSVFGRCAATGPSPEIRDMAPRT